MNKEKIIERCGATIAAAVVCACVGQAQQAGASRKAPTGQSCCGPSRQNTFSKRQAAKFALRAETLLGAGPAGKGEWGLLIMDAETGETLYEQNRSEERRVGKGG